MSKLSSLDGFISSLLRNTGWANPTNKISKRWTKGSASRYRKHTTVSSVVDRLAKSSIVIRESTALRVQPPQSNCRKHERPHRVWLPRAASIVGSRHCLYASSRRNPSRSRQYSTATNEEAPGNALRYPVSKEELKGLVDTYSFDVDDEAFSNATVATEQRDSDRALSAPDEPRVVQNSAQTRPIVKELMNLLQHRHTPNEQLYNVYHRLPEPRSSFVPDEVLGRLVRHVSVVEHKSYPEMVRYLSLIGDLKRANVPIPLAYWNSAISFAGRCVKRVTETEIDSALQIWHEMEHEAGVESNHVTFNILFDVATKAGKFTLAEMIHKEMLARGLPFNRFFRTGLIYHHGLRKDGASVRKAYVELIDAGEIVDTAVINSVIAGLLQCGETVAAEQVFERMKRLHYEKISPTLPPTDWREIRALGRNLNRAVEAAREEYPPPPEENEGEAPKSSPAQDEVARLREETSVAPNLRTYKILVHYNAVTAGDIDRVAELADEMEEFGVGLHGSIFLHLFHAFSAHGGVLYSQWTRRRLESTWSAFVAAADATLDAEEGDENAEGYDAEAQRDDNGDVQYVTSANSGEEEGDSPPNFETTQEDTSLVPTTSNPHTDSDPAADPDDDDDTDPEAPPRTAAPEVYVSKAGAKIICKAFSRCSNLSRTAEVWVELKKRWLARRRPAHGDGLVLDDMQDVEDEICAVFRTEGDLFREMVREKERLLG